MAAPAAVRQPSGLFVPRNASGAINPLPDTTPVAVQPAALTTEYLSSDGYGWLNAMVRSLPRYIDDVTRDLGDDLYERMALDACVRGNLHTLKAAIAADGIQLTSAVPDADADGHDLAETILQFCQDTIEDLEPSIDHVLWDLLDALILGNRLAELVYKHDQTDSGPKLVLTSIKVKPRISYAYAMDPYNNLVGVLGLIPGKGYPVSGGLYALDPKHTPNLIGPEKFAILTIRPRENDPRGTSLLRSAYTAWWQKMQVWPEYLKYLTQFASPLIAAIQGMTATAPAPARDATGRPIPGTMLTPGQQLLMALEQLRNGGVIVLPNGTILDIKQSQGDGTAFLKAFDLHDKQITIAMLSQTLATGEGQHQSRASSQVHQDILGTLVLQLKNMVIRVLRKQVLARMVAYNYGDKAARQLTPNVGLGETEKQDQIALLKALATVPGFTVFPSQLPQIYEQAGLPPADPDEVAAAADAITDPPVVPPNPPNGKPEQPPDEEEEQPPANAPPQNKQAA